MSELSKNDCGRKAGGGTLLPTDHQRIRNEVLVNLVREGMTAAEAGRRVGLKSSHAARIAKLYGVERKVGRPRIPRRDEALLDGRC